MRSGERLWWGEGWDILGFYTSGYPTTSGRKMIFWEGSKWEWEVGICMT